MANCNWGLSLLPSEKYCLSVFSLSQVYFEICQWTSCNLTPGAFHLAQNSGNSARNQTERTNGTDHFGSVRREYFWSALKVVYFIRSYQSWQICCSQYFILLTRTIWPELVNLCTNHSFVTKEQCTCLFCWCIHVQQSDFIMIWWISGPFLWWFLFYFGFGCVCIWRESNVRWPGSCLWNRTFNVPLGMCDFRIFVEWKAPLESPYVGGRLLVL